MPEVDDAEVVTGPVRGPGGQDPSDEPDWLVANRLAWDDLARLHATTEL